MINQLPPPETIFLEAMDSVATEGAALVPGFLDEEATQLLQEHLAQAAFREQDKTYKSGVDEKFQIMEDPDVALELLIDEVSAQVQAGIRSGQSRYPGLGDWEANDIAVQKYGPGSLITSHRDPGYCYGVVAVLTLQGYAIFRTSATRVGPALHKWRTQPGDLVILRSTKLTEANEPQLFHSIGGPLTEEDRISLGLRDRRNDLE